MCTIGMGSIYYKFHTLYKFHERKIQNLRLFSVLWCTLGVGCAPKITHCLKYFSEKDFFHIMSACFFSLPSIFFLSKIFLSVCTFIISQMYLGDFDMDTQSQGQLTKTLVPFLFFFNILSWHCWHLGTISNLNILQTVDNYINSDTNLKLSRVHTKLK